jgi:hypothetical protein
MPSMKAELEQEGCARAIRRPVHVILAPVQVFPVPSMHRGSQIHNVSHCKATTKACSARSNSTEARYFAAVVPFLNSMRLLIYGLRLYTDEALVKSVTREGKPE